MRRKLRGKKELDKLKIKEVQVAHLYYPTPTVLHPEQKTEVIPQ